MSWLLYELDAARALKHEHLSCVLVTFFGWCMRVDSIRDVDTWVHYDEGYGHERDYVWK